MNELELFKQNLMMNLKVQFSAKCIYEHNHSGCFDLGLCSHVNILCRHCFNSLQTTSAM